MNNKKPTAVTVKQNQMFRDAIALHQSGQFDFPKLNLIVIGLFIRMHALGSSVL